MKGGDGNAPCDVCLCRVLSCVYIPTPYMPITEAAEVVVRDAVQLGAWGKVLWARVCRRAQTVHTGTFTQTTPATAHLLACMATNHRCVVIEDSGIGLRAAKAAGMT